MDGIGSRPVSAILPAKMDTWKVRRRARFRDFPNCQASAGAVTFDLNSSLAQAMDQRVHWVSARVCHRNLYVHVGAPRRDVSRLRFHCLCVVGEALRRNRPVWNKLEHLRRETVHSPARQPSSSVSDRRKSFDEGAAAQFADPARSRHPHRSFTQAGKVTSSRRTNGMCMQNQSAASRSECTIASGGVLGASPGIPIDQNRATPTLLSRFHIAPAVSDHETRGEIDMVLPGPLQEQPRFGLRQSQLSPSTCGHTKTHPPGSAAASFWLIASTSSCVARPLARSG